MTEQKKVRLIFAGGGTGGHLFPAIAIADKVKEMINNKMQVEILFIGTKRGIEYRMKDKIGYPLHIINMRGIVRSFSLKNLLVPFIIITALFKSFLLLKKFKPHIVIGTGGYVSWPILKVAGWKNVTTLLQEQNSFPGVTTRQLAGSAKKIYLGFDAARNFITTEAEIIVTGNPVRPEIVNLSKEDASKQLGLDSSKKTILILGGSQGARAINNAVLKSYEKNKYEQIQLLWQTGKRDYKEVEVKAAGMVQSSSLFPFAENMSLLYSAADVVIARAGALTLAEIMHCKIPSILIPFPYAAGDHQKKNALDYVQRNMARMIEEKDIESHDIINEAVQLCMNSDYVLMKEAIEKETNNIKPAVDIIAEDIIVQLEAVA